MKCSFVNISTRGLFLLALLFFVTPLCHGQTVFKALRDDIASLLREPDFYSVIGGLSLAPSLIEHESKAIDHSWMNSVKADRFFEAGEIMGDALVPCSLFPGLRLLFGREIF